MLRSILSECYDVCKLIEYSGITTTLTVFRLHSEETPVIIPNESKGRKDTIRRAAIWFLVLAGALAPVVLPAAEIHDAVEAQNAAGLAEILAANPNLASATNSAGLTPFHLAVRVGATDAATFLVKNTQSAYLSAFLDVRTPQGKAALASGDLAMAYELLTAMLKDDPRNENINFAQGLASLSTESYSLAKLAFERVLEMNPKNGRARAELGRTYLAMGNLELAAKHLQAALSEATSDEVRQKIERLLSQTSQEVSRSKTQARVYAGYVNDSNVNVGPDSDIISIYPIIWGSETLDALFLQDSSKPLDAQGAFLSLMLSHIYDGGEPGGWSATGDLAYYQNWLDGEPDYESLFTQLMFGMKRMRQRDLLHLPLKIAYISSGHEPLVNLYGVHPRFIYVGGQAGDMHWQTVAACEFRDYDELDDRDGPYFSLSQGLKQFFGDNKHNVYMGLEVFHDHADAASYEHTGNAWFFGANISLPWGMALYGRGRYAGTDYSERETLAPDDRSDTQNQVGIGVKKSFGGRLSVDINYQQTENNSTFTLYQYDRSVTTVSTAFRF